MSKLNGKIALITGGNSGIGLATAKAFVAEGAYVYIAGRREPELQRALTSLGPNAAAVRADVSSLRDLDRLFIQIKKEKGQLDILFANAGVASVAPIGSVTEAQYDRIFNTNVKGLLFTVQKALPLIPDGGTVILTGSIVGIKGAPGLSVYSSTKAAVRSFARSWTTDLKHRKIRVNAISPGPIETPGVDNLGDTEEQRSTVRANLVSMTPLGRMGQPEEIARVAVFLASDDASYIAGAELFVDGGAAQV